jgi:hypothetical protein
MEGILALVREMAVAQTWSAGVALARNATFHEEQESPSAERNFRIIQGPRDRIVSVSISEASELWQCDCELEEDPCRHVVATLLALKQDKVLPISGGFSQRAFGAVQHEFSRSGTALLFNRYVCCGDDRIAITGSLLEGLAAAKKKGMTVIPTDYDLRVDHVLPHSRQGILDPKTMRYLIPALSRVPMVLLDGERIVVRAEPIPVVAEVVDDEQGFLLRRAAIDGISEVFDNGAAICHGALHSVEDSALRMEDIEMLRGYGTVFNREDAIELATRIVPQLQGKIEVRVLSRRLPRARKVAPRVVIEALSDDHASSVTVIPRIVYGMPTIAEIRHGELVMIDQREIPIREPAEEGRLAREVLLKLGLSVNEASVIKGVRAVQLLQQLQSWEVVGDAKERFTPVGVLSAQAHAEYRDLQLGFGIVGEGVDARPIETTVSARAVLEAWRKGESYLQVASGSWAALPTEWLRNHAHAVERIIAAKTDFEACPARMVNEVHELCEALSVEPPEYFSRLKAGLSDVDSIPAAQLPTALTAKLRSYQRVGVNWISFLHQHRLGALLADDMGLGKTLQALSLMQGRVLVVCPTSVLASWKQQAADFRPDLRVGIYHGAKRSISDQDNLTITSYALLRLDLDVLESIEWDTVILDESQTIRNPHSQVAQAAFRLRSKQRLNLSGTPVENSLDDLWSQFRFLNPGLLGSYQEFQSSFVQPILSGNTECTLELRRRVSPFIMRRLKRDVAQELPPKTEVVLQCELAESERVAYDALLGVAKGQLRELLSDSANMISALEVLLRLRQACCHIGLLPGHDAPTSSKVELLVESLESSIAQGHRALVFSQWTSFLNLIEPHLAKHSISFCRIDGTTEGRGDIVDAFQSDDGPRVMLLSLKAGGLGLTLTAADHVYIVDPWWNPAAEDQAGDRAYRIGQKNPVIVHRLVAKDTIEERILKIQHSKRALLSAAIGESGSLSLTKDEILGLLELS